jgi:hypothetical protein
MRRLISKHEEEKKKKLNQFLVGGVLVFIMLMSVLGFSLRGRENAETKNKIIYNGIEFRKQNNFWFADINGLEFAFSYNPQQTENISATFFLNVNNLYAKPLYIYSENTETELEIYRNLDQIVLRRQYACLEGENCTESWPNKTCEDNFIIIKEIKEAEKGENGEDAKEIKTEIKQEDNCIFIQGKREDLLRAVDKFLFKILGIQ